MVKTRSNKRKTRSGKLPLTLHPTGQFCKKIMGKHINLDAGRVNYPRSKTGVARNLPLWKETIEALKTIPKVDQYLFRTRRGNKLVRVVEKPSKGGMTRLISYSN